jgi:hypothetical protein
MKPVLAAQRSCHDAVVLQRACLGQARALVLRLLSITAIGDDMHNTMLLLYALSLRLSRIIRITRITSAQKLLDGFASSHTFSCSAQQAAALI